MKKIIFSLSALAALLLAGSCQKENLEPAETGSNTVTYSVQVPDAIATKANPGSVAGVTELVYEVYRLDANGQIASLAYEDVVTLQNGETQWDLELEFVNDQKFQVLFWAQKPNVGAYNTADLRKVSLNSAELTANVDNYAAFAGHDYVTNCVSHKEGNVTLVRPISQIQVGTDAAGLVLGTSTEQISLTSSSMLVKGLPTSYNVANGEVSASEQDVEYTVNAVPAGTFTANSNEYTYVAQNYVAFADAMGTTVEVDFTVTTSEGDIQHTVSNVPLKPNYRTNIIGNLITENADYSIDLEANWADDDKSMEVIVDGLVKNINGDYEVTEAKGLAYAINNLFAVGGNFYLTAPLYDLSGFAVTPPTVPAGVTLNIYGETPVVTRSSAAPVLGGVTIIGLDGALIDVVEGAVSVSGVTLESDDQSQPTVLVNEVKETASVVVSDCVADTIVTTGEEYVVDASEVTDLASLQAALASGVKEVVIKEALTITGEVKIDLNGKIVKAVDQKTESYGMITNKGTLVIDGEGTLQLSAENDRGWNAYSSVISNTVGGHLTVNKDVVIEHLGGTSMAYGIDNLTNGKGTSAIAVINGATVKSTYRAIRQFLNGVEANNSLTVKAGSVVESTSGNKGGIWMQDPSANANSGSLVVEDGAKVSSIYLDVNPGSTAWPVEVSIAKSSIPEGKLTLENIPAGYYIVEVANAYTVIKMSEVNTAEALIEALENGNNVKFASDITIDPATLSNAYGTTGINVLKGQTIDGNGHVLNIKGANGTWDSGINTTGGLIKNLTITGSFRGLFVNHNSTHSEKVILEDVIIDGTIYTISCDQATNQGLEARNSTFNGWTSYAGTLGAAKFINCTFGEGNGYAFFRPYAPTSFVNCEFEAGYELDPQAAVSFENCTLDGVALNGTNLKTLVTSNFDNVKAYASDLASLKAGIALGVKTVVLEKPITIESGNTTLDLSGVNIEAPEVDGFVVKSGAALVLKNAKLTSHGAVVRAVGGKITIESGEFTQTGTAVASPSTYRYAIDCREGGEIVINGGTFKSNNGLINVSSTVTINGGKFENVVEKTMTRHFAYVSAPLTINDGEFYGKANSSAGGCFFCGAAAGGKIEVNGGKFTSLWTSGSVNRIFESYYGGTITVTGGMFNTNGGIATFVTENTDEATKAAYPYVAK